MPPLIITRYKCYFKCKEKVTALGVSTIVCVHVCCENLSPPHMKNRRNENFPYVSKIPLASFLLFIGPESNYCLVLSQLLHGFVKVVLYISCSLPNKTKVKFDQDFKPCWSICFEVKVLNSQSTECLGSAVPVAMFYFPVYESVQN